MEEHFPRQAGRSVELIFLLRGIPLSPCTALRQPLFENVTGGWLGGDRSQVTPVWTSTCPTIVTKPRFSGSSSEFLGLYSSQEQQ